MNLWLLLHLELKLVEMEGGGNPLKQKKILNINVFFFNVRKHINYSYNCVFFKSYS